VFLYDNVGFQYTQPQGQRTKSGLSRNRRAYDISGDRSYTNRPQYLSSCSARQMAQCGALLIATWRIATLLFVKPALFSRFCLRALGPSARLASQRGLCAFRLLLRLTEKYSVNPTMPTTLPLLDFDHQKGFEIPTKYKEATRQLYNFANVPTGALEFRYKLVYNCDVLVAWTHRLTELGLLGATQFG
jgi:hypothetical protein